MINDLTINFPLYKFIDEVIPPRSPISTLQTELNSFDQWIVANKMHFNITKTKKSLQSVLLSAPAPLDPPLVVDNVYLLTLCSQPNYYRNHIKSDLEFACRVHVHQGEQTPRRATVSGTERCIS